MLSDTYLSLPYTNQICCRFFGDECALFHGLNGQTHCIDGLGTEIFKKIIDQPTSLQRLYEQFSADFEFPDGFDLLAHLQQLTAEYRQLGLLDMQEQPLC